MSIQSRLIAGLFVAALPLLFVGLLVVRQTDRIAAEFDRILEETTPAITILRDLETSVHRLFSEAISYALLRSTGAVDRSAREELEELQEARERILTLLDRYGELPGNDRRIEFERNLRTQVEALDRETRALVTDGSALSVRANKEILEEREETLEELIREAHVFEESLLRDQSVRARDTVGLLVLLVLGASSFLLLFIAGFAYVIHLNIARPLAVLRQAVDDLGDGNLDADPAVYSNDEIGVLSRAFRRMAGRLRVSTVSRRYVNEILETMDDMLCVVSHSQGVIRTVNLALTRTLGYTSAELVGRPWTLLVPEYGADLDPVRELEELRRVGSLQIHLGHSSGDTIPVKFSTALMRDTDESYVVCTARDISTDLRNESMLRQARDDARMANRAKSEFLANISHEIRTPLHAILGTADLLAESSLKAEDRRHLGNMTRAGETLLHLINEILDISRIEAGALDIREEQFELAPWFEETCGIHEAAMGSRGLEFRRERADGMPRFIKADPKRLRQVLNNLIGNALKFTEKGGVTVRVAPGDSAAELVFSVTDTGIGVPPEKQESIFRAFEQADSSITRRYGGTGLGLAISRMLVSRMGGRLWLTAPDTGGSVFHFTLPLTVVTDSPDPEKVDPVESQVPRLEEVRLLLAEDNEDNSNLILAFLKRTAVRVELVRDGRSAVEAFKAGSFDLVLLDVQMPVLDGYSAAREIRAWEKENGRTPTPLLALTAHAMETDRQRSLDAGCDAHLTKPLRKQTLLDAVAEYSKAKSA